MRIGVFTVTLAVVVSGVSSASAMIITDPAQSPAYLETSLYEVYNNLYGSSYTSSASLVNSQKLSWETYVPREQDQSMRFWGVWSNAWFNENFGYYTDDDKGGQFTSLFSVPGMTNGRTNAYIGDTRNVDGSYSYVAVADLTGPMGFYNDPVNWSSSTNYGRLYSESGRNDKGERHFVVLATPHKDTYLLAIEDLTPDINWSHQDFNDLIIELQVGTKPVPEPATLTLLGLGLAGLALRKARRVRGSKLRK